MKKLLANYRNLFALAIAMLFTMNGFACDRSSLVLNGFTALPGGQYQINMTFSCGAGANSTHFGGDQPTGDFGFFISGAQLVNYPATLVSPNTSATFASNLTYADTILVYENPSQWWACIDPSCGNVQTVSKSISIVTQGLPTNIVLLGMEGAGSIFGCEGAAMTIDFSCNAFSASAGVDKEVFPAYSPAACTILTASGIGGSGNYSYLWSTGATTAVINVCPTTTTTYTVTITDNAYGCSKTDAVTVTSTNITCANNRVYVCRGGVTRCVPKSQVAGQLAAGGVLGVCKNKTSNEFSEMFVNGLEVAPNPAHENTKAIISVAERSLVTLALYDINGRQVRSIVNETREIGEHEVGIDLNDLKPGLYIARLTVGSEGFTTKLMVQ